MLTLHPSQARTRLNLGWLDQRQTFPIARPNPGWFGLRVINEDRIAPRAGFGLHGHRDMEIITYVLAGTLAPHDDLGNTTVVPAGHVQRMSAGTGVKHSEFNPDSGMETHFLQIWVEPAKAGIPPDYEQMKLHKDGKLGPFRLFASPEASDGSMHINAHARLYIGHLGAGEDAGVPMKGAGHGYLHVVTGNVLVNGIAASAGDGVFLEDERDVRVANGEAAAEIIAFDLA